MKVLGIIPARGGSKGILRKNLAPLNGKPLLYYTCQAARESMSLTRVVLSTEDAVIAAAGKKFGIDVPFMRPRALSADMTPMFDVVEHTVKKCEDDEGFYPELVVLLQPTSPLRTASHIDAAVKELVSSKADTVVSVIETPHQFGPASVMKLDPHGFLKPFITGKMILRRQDRKSV